MTEWASRLFIERSHLFLRLLNQRWLKTEEVVNEMAKVLGGFGIKSGNLVDLCCGNALATECTCSFEVVQSLCVIFVVLGLRVDEMVGGRGIFA